MKKISIIFIFSLVLTNVFGQYEKDMNSILIDLEITSGKQRIVLTENRHFEAPNWSRDGAYFIINSNGKLEKISLNGDNLGLIPTGFAENCNNDHGLTFDGKTLIISHNDKTVSDGANSRIFILPEKGGTPTLVTNNFPSYWHGVSPDGKKLVYCAERNGNWDVYQIDRDGKNETQLTNSEGLDDGPEYSYDGQWIYFNSHRTGRMHIYRMKPDGTHQEQLTFDDFDNWFPHPSPDNKTVAYISYLKDQKGAHPFGKDVKIRLLEIETGETKDLTDVFFGGQGSLNVHSWSPDGKHLAFVKYK
ncbi:TolB family protein [Namhaeicola litoreus]|uniref:TolB family protein n=1 Tax=Namhaeicola litoreus TaxID=1052145 RepID=A0ABW3Y1V9_9FLAO